MSRDISNLSEIEDKMIKMGCCPNCGGCCILRAHAKDVKIVRIESDKLLSTKLIKSKIL